MLVFFNVLFLFFVLQTSPVLVSSDFTLFCYVGGSFNNNSFYKDSLSNKEVSGIEGKDYNFPVSGFAIGEGNDGSSSQQCNTMCNTKGRLI